MYPIELIIVCATTIIGSRAVQLPSYITPCSSSLPTDELSDCITIQAKSALPYFSKGVPEFQTEPLDPLSLEDINAQAGTFTIKSKNVILRGLKDIQIQKVTWDMKKNKAAMKFFGNLTFISDYETDGRILVVPITGTGKLIVKLYDTEILIKYKFRKVKRPDGAEHLETFDLKPSQSYGNVKFHMTNVLGSEIIGETINRVLNENWRDLMTEVGPPYIKAVAQKVHEIVNKVYSSVPYYELFAP